MNKDRKVRARTISTALHSGSQLSSSTVRNGERGTERRHALLVVQLAREVARGILVPEADRPAKQNGHGLVRCVNVMGRKGSGEEVSIDRDHGSAASQSRNSEPISRRLTAKE